VIYRMRIYQAVPENLPVFHEFFRAHLLPVQLRHGSRLVGRWETEDGRVVAVWEYDDRPPMSALRQRFAPILIPAWPGSAVASYPR
jgi:hypothetical protein